VSGGRFARCPKCGRLCIYGQACTCGQRTDLPVEVDPFAAYGCDHEFDSLGRCECGAVES